MDQPVGDFYASPFPKFTILPRAQLQLQHYTQNKSYRILGHSVTIPESSQFVFQNFARILRDADARRVTATATG